MSAISNERKEQLEKLDIFIENAREKLSSIVSALGWSIESLSKVIENIVVCPFNDSHHIPERTLEKHLEECQWKAEGYSKADAPLSIPSLPPGAASSLKFDEQLQDSVIQNAKQKNPTMAIGARGRLIPRTSDRLVADFTRDERCAMYEYVIENTMEPDMGEDIADMNKPKSPSDGRKSSYLELLAQERNLKRRRAKYRGVHTNKKSQVEILREVISQQMEMLGEYISEKSDDPSRCSAKYLPTDDPPQDVNGDTRRHDDSRRVDYSGATSADGNGRRRESCKKSCEDRSFRCESSIDRGYDRGHGDSRDRDRRSNDSRDKTNYYGEHRRENSRDRRSRKTNHKSHRNRSKDRQRHKWRRSRDRERSRSSRDAKSESSRESKHKDRKKKKRRSRD